MTKEKVKEWRLFACAALLAFLAGLIMAGCASVPREPCLDRCWVMQARNDNYYEARVYVNGARVATLPSLMGKSVGIPITRSMLDGAGCLVVYVRLYPDSKTASSERECPNDRSRLELSIEESYGMHPLHVWLNNWAAR